MIIVAEKATLLKGAPHHRAPFVLRHVMVVSGSPRPRGGDTAIRVHEVPDKALAALVTQTRHDARRALAIEALADLHEEATEAAIERLMPDPGMLAPFALERRADVEAGVMLEAWQVP